MTKQQPLPPGVFPYRRTPVFDEKTMPAGLRREHRTAAGVWGSITFVEGRLRFRRIAPPSEVVLEAGNAAVAAPEEPHEVEPDGPVRFFVEFCRAGTPKRAGT
jgi:tellurite resistance-related uncharacterized protein